MDSSNEDIFSETSPTELEDIRLSRFTIYHSAPDLPDSLAEDANLVDRNTVKKSYSQQVGIQTKSVMFGDGVRSVDFVLAWLESRSSDLSAEPKRSAFERHLEEEGLQLEREVTDRLHVVKIHAPKEVLCRYAEILRLRLPMKQIPLEGMLESDYDIVHEVKSFFSKLISCVHLDPSVFPREKFRLSAEYNRHKSYLFDEEDENFFSSQIRMIIVDFILLRTSYQFEKEPDSKTALSDVGIEKLINDGVYRAAYPLHDGDPEDSNCLRGKLFNEWAQMRKWAMYQPIDHIREYFGVKVALYFAWLGFYTHMLIPASIFGIFCFIYGIITVPFDQLSDDICNESLNITMCPLCDASCDYWKLDETCTYAKFTYLFDNPITIVFAFFMSFWAALFLELWKRYSASIAHKWGLTDFSIQNEPPRPEYIAQIQQSKRKKFKTDIITGRKEPYLPFWTAKLPAILMSYSVVIMLILVALAAVFGVVLYRMSLVASDFFIEDTEWGDKVFVIPATAALINLIFINILNYVYDKLAVNLTELEKHRTQTEFDESLTLKIYLFQFVNYYASIMYIAFLKGKFVGYPAKYNRIFGYRQEECNPGGCLMELSIQLAMIMVGQQFFSGIVEMLTPLVQKHINTVTMQAMPLFKGISKSESSSLVVDPHHKRWTEDFKLLDWGSRGMFYEYLEMVVQYGFVTLFVTAFPLAPFFALLNNIFEMRLDARKFLLYYRRPVPWRAANIGVWFRILSIIGRFAVISNAFIIAFSSSFIPKLVYRAVTGSDSDVGFLNHSLSVFDTKDFPPHTAPRHPSYNVSICRYSAYRAPPGPGQYKRTILYWHILAARLAFIVVFQNLVSIVVLAVQWLIPDVPASVKEQIKNEIYLTNEMIIQHETTRARRTFNYGSSDSTHMIRNEQGDNVRKRISNNFRLEVDNP